MSGCPSGSGVHCTQAAAVLEPMTTGYALLCSLINVLPGNVDWSPEYLMDLRKCVTMPNTLTNQILHV